jgi:hypothetical protein
MRGLFLFKVTKKKPAKLDVYGLFAGLGDRN